MKTQSDFLDERDAMDFEHQAWLRMFDELSKVSGISHEELNKPQWRKFFESIEEWGYYEFGRRITLNDFKKEGCLWTNQKEVKGE